jgi:hypothetical protein
MNVLPQSSVIFSTVKMERACSPEKWHIFYQPTQNHAAEDSSVYSPHHDNLSPHEQ